MPDSVRIDIDARRFRAATQKLGRKLKPTARKGLRKGANILKKEIQLDYRGRVLRRRTGALAKAVTVRKGRDRGTEVSMVVTLKGPRAFVGRLHETGYTINPMLKTRKRFGERVGKPIQIKIGGRWVTLNNPTPVPGKHVFERQIDAQEPKVWAEVRTAFRAVIREAGLA